MATISALLLVPSLPSSNPSSISSRNSVFFKSEATKVLSYNKNGSCVALRSRSRESNTSLKVRCLFGLGVPEFVVIVGVAAIVFGPKKLPEIGRSIGKTVRSFQEAAKEFETELKRETETDPTSESSSVQNATIVNEEKKKDLETTPNKENS